jgi:hypothetical protein
LHDFKKIPDAGARDVANVMGDVLLEVHALQMMREKDACRPDGGEAAPEVRG